jgi:hypothetical protein
MQSRKISEIEIEIDPECYSESIYVTIDIDWASDSMISDTLNLLEEKNVRCTFFVTHQTPLLSRIRNNPNFELGIHPNLNPLLHEDMESIRSAKECFEDLLAIVPEAQSFRCHSLVTSSRIVEIAFELGLKFDCNYFIPYEANIKLRPWSVWNGIIRVPHLWEDDVSLRYGLEDSRNDLESILKKPGLKVFDFHPIHISLNTEHLNRYEAFKAREKTEMDSYKNYTCTGYGTRNKFEFILQKATNNT